MEDKIQNNEELANQNEVLNNSENKQKKKWIKPEIESLTLYGKPHTPTETTIGGPAS